MRHEPNPRLRLRVLLATITGITAGLTRPIAERILDWLAH